MFEDIIKFPNTYRVYVSNKIESLSNIADLKCVNKQVMANIFDTLVIDNAFLTHKKLKSYKKINRIIYQHNLTYHPIIKFIRFKCCTNRTNTSTSSDSSPIS